MDLSVITAENIQYAVYALALALGLFGALLGFVRGMSRQTVRLITVVASAAISFFACIWAYPVLNNYLTNDLGIEGALGLISSLGVSTESFGNILIHFDDALLAELMAMPATLVVLPVLFVVLFVLLSSFMMIFYRIICGALGFKSKRRNLLSRAVGFAIGAVQGIMVAVVLLIPIMGITNMVGNSVAEMKEQYPDTVSVTAASDTYNKYLGGMENNHVAKLSISLSDIMYDKFAKVEFEGEAFDMRDCVKTSVKIVVLFGEIDTNNLNHLTDNEKAVVSDIAASISDNRYLASVVSGGLRGISGAFEDGTIPLEFEEPILGFAKKFIGVFATSNKDNIGGDLDTLLNVCFLLGDSGTLDTFQQDPEHVFDKFVEIGPDGTTLMSKLTHTLSANPRMEFIVSDLTRVSMQLLLAGREQDMAKAEEAITDVTNTLDTIISMDKESYETEEEYKAAVNETVDATLKDHGLELEPEEVDQLSDFILSELGDREEITDAEVADFMLKYYEIYANGQIPEDLPQLP